MSLEIFIAEESIVLEKKRKEGNSAKRRSHPDEREILHETAVQIKGNRFPKTTSEKKTTRPAALRRGASCSLTARRGPADAGHATGWRGHLTLA